MIKFENLKNLKYFWKNFKTTQNKE